MQGYRLYAMTGHQGFSPLLTRVIISARDNSNKQFKKKKG
jgi:hypothetical protein